MLQPLKLPTQPAPPLLPSSSPPPLPPPSSTPPPLLLPIAPPPLTLPEMAWRFESIQCGLLPIDHHNLGHGEMALLKWGLSVLVNKIKVLVEGGKVGEIPGRRLAIFWGTGPCYVDIHASFCNSIDILL